MPVAPIIGPEPASPGMEELTAGANGGMRDEKAAVGGHLEAGEHTAIYNSDGSVELVCERKVDRRPKTRSRAVGQ